MIRYISLALSVLLNLTLAYYWLDRADALNDSRSWEKQNEQSAKQSLEVANLLINRVPRVDAEKIAHDLMKADGCCKDEPGEITTSRLEFDFTGKVIVIRGPELDHEQPSTP